MIGQRLSLYGGLGLVSLSSVALSVVLTRLYSAVLGYHFAFLALSLALLGVGLGASVVTLAPRVAHPPGLFGRLATLSGLAFATSVVALIQTLRTKSVETVDGDALRALGVLFVVSLVPFTLVGVIVTATLKHARRAAPRLYLADMVGAALGGVVALGGLQLGAPRAGLTLSMGFAIAAVLFAFGSGDPKGPLVEKDERGGRWTAWAFLLSGVSLLAGDYGEQWLTVSTLRFVNLDRATYVGWGELALVTVDKPTRGMAWMRVDGSAATAILDAKTTPPKHPDQMAFALAEGKGSALVIGAGGGRDVRAALDSGVTDVDAVEINRMVARDVMLGKLRDYSGGLFEKPGVNLYVADGRSFVRASEKRYRTIVLSLVDTWAAASVGGLSLSENGLYTVEAFGDYLDHVEDGGALLVNRWDPEVDRGIALAAAALARRGATDPGAHLYACSHTRSTALLVMPRPIAKSELATLRKYCRTSRFTEVFAPDKRGTPQQAALAADPWGASATAVGPDVSPSTDDRPFFFYNVAARDLRATLADRAKLSSEQQGLGTLSIVATLAIGFGLAIVFLPMLRRRERPGGGARARTLGFFAAIGVAFILVELALTQILTTFLGHPLYALTTVLTALLGAAGLGAWLERATPAVEVAGRARARAVALVVLLVVAAVLLLRGTEALVGLPLGARVAVAVTVLVPLGALMGGLLPLGVLAAGSRDPRSVAWGFAINGFAGVLALSFGTVAAMHAGFSYLLFLSAVGYFVAAVLSPSARAPRAAP